LEDIKVLEPVDNPENKEPNQFDGVKSKGVQETCFAAISL